MATIHDVAQLAKVSIATVSRVLAQKDCVKHETKEAVLRAVDQLSYKPNAMARSLRVDKSNTIVVLVGHLKSVFHAEFIRGIEDSLRTSGYHLLFGSTSGDNTRETEYLDLIKESRVDGLILGHPSIDLSVLEEVRKYAPVVVAFDYVSSSSVPSISIDNESASRKMTNHLLSLGHTRIGHITGPSHRMLTQTRLRGFRQGLAQHMIVGDEAYIQEGGNTFEDGYEAANKLLAMQDRPTAIFAQSDSLAIGAMRAVHEKGLRIPQDIAITGFDNSSISAFVTPSLTTMENPTYTIGTQAVSMLLQQIQGEPLQDTHILLKDSLVLRESCGENRVSCNDDILPRM
ncbi:LacI family DNA-binding transcriptional regulator [Priestia megaterium]|uniref:LacI family DNA-binding transcriptional regulator n=1 Tax=Priestia megaterium TaxID=1404 RepID=UPI003672C8E1